MTDTDTDTDTDADTATDTDAETSTDTATATTRAVLAGPDGDGLGEALTTEGIEVEAIDGLATREALEAAGIADCSLFVLTDVEEATAIPIAKDCNPDLQVVIYARGSLPEFASRQTDLLVDPDLLDPAVVAEELAA